MIATILALLLKSGVIAGAALALSALPGLRSARERVDILRAGVCVLIALPVVMWIGPALVLPLLPAAETAPAMDPTLWAGDVGPVAGVSMKASILTPSATAVAAWAWGLGALAVMGRFALGLWRLDRWTRQGRPVTRREWTAPLERLSPAKRPRLVASRAIAAPMSWGLPPGVVLIDEACLARPDAARSVLAHELAHVGRRDWLFLSLSRLALALFWFNPVVWALHAVLIARTEDAADAAALAEVDPPTYARALVTLASDYGNPAAVGIAGPARTLARRITRIMKTHRPHPRSPLVTVLAVGGLIAVAAPVAAVELAPRQVPAPPAPSAPMAPPVAVAPPAPMALAAPMPAAPGEWAPEAPLPPAAPAGAWAPVPPVPPAPAAMPAPPAPPMSPQDVISIDGRRVEYRDLTPEERARVDAARAEARRAREQAREARAEAAVARTQALAAAREARAHAAEARAQARVQAGDGRAAAERARTQAAAARAQAAVARDQARAARELAVREVANARVHMAQGAEQMDRGAEQMREESVRLRDPAYRARQIERARERGDRVPTDAELEALGPRLARQADELAANADRMRAQAARAD